MPDRSARVSKIRFVGLVASVVAFCALALTLLANNRNTGFGGRITNTQQLTLFLIAGVLLVMQTAAYLLHRRNNRSRH